MRTLDERIAAIEDSDTLNGLRDSMQSIAEEYGFYAFSFIDNAQTHQQKPFHFGTSGEKWEEAYEKGEFIRVDPCLVLARRTNRAFVWAGTVDEAVRPGPKSRLSQLMEAAFDFGFKEGVVVPCHYRDKHGRFQSVSGVYYWTDPPKSMYKMLKGRFYELQFLMIYFVQRCSEILERMNAPAMPGIDLTPARPLSDRERDVLAWSALGKTTKEISEILEISDSTVELHVKHAIDKLGASNRTAAVVIAIRAGMISV